MSRKPCIAAIDVGTTSVKVCLFTPELLMLSVSVQEYALHTKGNFVEADAQQYLRAIRNGFAEALSAVPDYEIAAVGLSTQGETLTLADAQGEPLRPFIVWLDSRADNEAALLSKELPEQHFYGETGLPSVSGALPIAKLMWLKRNEPMLFERASRFILLEDHLLHRLTGRSVSEKSLQTSTGWFRLKTDGLWEEALSIAGLRADRFPEPVECGEVVGPLLPKAADFLGLPQGIPVVAGAMDQTAAALASGCIQTGMVTETTGTALVMAACTDSPVFSSEHHVTIYRHAIPGKYLYLPIANTGGMCLRWFRDIFCSDFPPGADGYNALNALASQVSCGCDGLIFLPFLAGSVDPDYCPDARAAFFGATLSTTRAHFARSIMESVAFLLKDFAGMLNELGQPVTTIYSLGGGAQSGLWEQIKADVLGQPLRVPVCKEASAAGAALLAGWGTGIIPRNTVPSCDASAIFTPNAEHAQAYRTAYSLYHKLYQAVRPLFTEEEEAQKK